MFDLSLGEIGLIALVALLVLGPERLPKAARTVGFYVRKARQSWYSVRAEFERELAADEMKRSLKLDEIHATLDGAATDVRSSLARANGELSDGLNEARAALDSAGSDDGLSEEERRRQTEALPEDPPEPLQLEALEGPDAEPAEPQAASPASESARDASSIDEDRGSR